jgi:hypothetical protein
MAAEAPSRPGVQVGPTSEFSLFFHVRPGHGEALREALRALQNSPGYRPGDYDVPIAVIHEARFVPFDGDTRLLFATSFDGPWDSYMLDFASKPLKLFDAIFQHVEGYQGLPDLQAVMAFILSAQVSAGGYARNYGGTVKEIRKAERVNKAFQQVLDDPAAAVLLQEPALAPPPADSWVPPARPSTCRRGRPPGHPPTPASSRFVRCRPERSTGHSRPPRRPRHQSRLRPGVRRRHPAAQPPRARVHDGSVPVVLHRCGKPRGPRRRPPTAQRPGKSAAAWQPKRIPAGPTAAACRCDPSRVCGPRSPGGERPEPGACVVAETPDSPH